ncbi:hypothetical protein [Pseudooceanicola sp. LIPI14-2-Ac024]|uniref:hypothetical protein n=1 Tax=Pseudooceanicola sp. LIPI14-2-Ac024 TaxID=3344875 RepID=UPI0035CF0432
MADFPSRMPEGDPERTRRFIGVYFVSRILGAILLLGILVGAVSGAAIGDWIGGRGFPGLMLGALIGGLITDRACVWFIRKNERALDQHHHDMEANREAEYQRKLAEAKTTGAFDRWNADKDDRG